MSAVLKAYGTDFDVDAFLAGCTIPVCALKRRGDPVFPNSQPNGRRHTGSGVHVLVSDAPFTDFLRQTDEATRFLSVEAAQVRRLCEFPGVRDVILDFGIERRDIAVQIDHLPSALIRLAGSLGLGIELSHYPAPDGEQDAEQDTEVTS